MRTQGSGGRITQPARFRRNRQREPTANVMSEYPYSNSAPNCASRYLAPIVAELVTALPKGRVVLDLMWSP